MQVPRQCRISRSLVESIIGKKDRYSQERNPVKSASTSQAFFAVIVLNCNGIKGENVILIFSYM